MAIRITVNLAHASSPVTTPFFTVHTFGLLLAAAYIAAYWWLTREGRRKGLDVDALALFGFWAIIGAVIGARVLMILRALPDKTAVPAELFTSRFSRALVISMVGLSAR